MYTFQEMCESLKDFNNNTPQYIDEVHFEGDEYQKNTERVWATYMAIVINDMWPEICSRTKTLLLNDIHKSLHEMRAEAEAAMAQLKTTQGIRHEPKTT